MTTLPPVGSIVEAFGLKTYEAVNGQRGTVVKHQTGGDGKTVLPLVQFPEPTGKLMLKPTNVRVVDVGSTPAAPALSDSQKEHHNLSLKYPKGTEVEATGLKSQAHLNGAKGRVDSLRAMPEGATRVVVDFGPPHGLNALRAVNVKPSEKTRQRTERGGSVSPRSPRESLTRKSSSPSPRDSLTRKSSSHRGSIMQGDSRRMSVSSNASRSSRGNVRRDSSNSMSPATGLVTFQDRYATFASWPAHLQGGQVNPRELALAGFYHNASQKDPDRCTCFTCGYSLVNWGANDVPWNEHSKHVTTCAFVQAHKASLKASASLKGKARGSKELKPLDEEGYLKKQKPGNFTKGWDERYFALRGTTLYYYEEKGQIDLSRGCQCTVIDTDSTSFTVNGVGQTREAFALRASDEFERNKWMEALNGSKERPMSKDDMEALMGFETAEAETRTQLIFEASQHTTLLAGKCIVRSMKISSILENEFQEKNARLKTELEEVTAFGDLQKEFQKRRSQLHLARCLQATTTQQNKAWLYSAWRQAAVPTSSTTPESEASDREAAARTYLTLNEQQERCALMTHLLTLTLADLNKGSRSVTSLREELDKEKAKSSAGGVSATIASGTEVIAHGLKNMASLNGKRGVVKENQMMKDGTNVTLVEFPSEDGTPAPPILLRIGNVFATPPTSVINLLNKEPLAKLSEAQSRIEALEAELKGMASIDSTAASSTATRLEEGAANIQRLETEKAQLAAELQTARSSSSIAADVGSDPSSFTSDPRVVYSPLPLQGSRVIVHDLTSMESLNGKIGEVLEHTALPDGTDVSKVRFDDPNTTVLLRRESTTQVPSETTLERLLAHLHAPLLAENGSLSLSNSTLLQEVEVLRANARSSADSPGEHREGVTVVAHSLSTDAELNGLAGVVVESNNLADGAPSSLVRFNVPKKNDDGVMTYVESLRRLRNANLDGLPREEVAAVVKLDLLKELAAVKEKLGAVESELLVASSHADSRAEVAAVGSLDVGSNVMAHGLRNRAELNGLKGRVLQKQVAPNGTEALVVDFFEKNMKLALRKDNLAPAAHPAVVALLEEPLLAKISLLEASLASPPPPPTPPTPLTPAPAEPTNDLPEIGSNVITHDILADPDQNHRFGTITEHRELPDGGSVCVVLIEGEGERTMLLRSGQCSVLPEQKVLDALRQPAERKQKMAEAALEMERMNHRALQREAETISTLPPVGSYFVATNLMNAPNTNGRLGKVIEMKTLNETTEAIVADIFDAGSTEEEENRTTMMLKAGNTFQIEKELYEAIVSTIMAKAEEVKGQLESDLAMLKEGDAERRKQNTDLEEEIRTSAERLSGVEQELEAMEATAGTRQAEVLLLQKELEDASRARLDQDNTVDTFTPLPLLIEQGRSVLVVPPANNNGPSRPQKATIVSQVDENTVCVKLASDTSANIGTLVAMSTLIALPEAGGVDIKVAQRRQVQPEVGCLLKVFETKVDSDGNKERIAVSKRGVVVSRLDASRVCVKVDGDSSSDAGEIVDIDAVLPLPNAEVEDALLASLRAELSRVTMELAGERADAEALNEKMAGLEAEHREALEASTQRLGKLDALLEQQQQAQSQSPQRYLAGGGGGSGCAFCSDLRREVQELLRQSEAERVSQQHRQDRMLGALQDQARSRSHEEARLFSVIDSLQRKTEGTAVSRAFTPMEQSPHLALIAGATLNGYDTDYHRVLPDGELHNAFAAIASEAAAVAEEHARCEAALLRDHAAAAAERRDTSAILSQLTSLRQEMLDTRRRALQQQMDLLQAVHIRRDAESDLLNDLERTALTHHHALNAHQHSLLQTLHSHDEYSVRMNAECIDILQTTLAEHCSLEEGLAGAVARLQQQGKPSNNAYPLDELDALIQSVGDSRLRSILEGMRGELRGNVAVRPEVYMGGSVSPRSRGGSPTGGSGFSAQELTEMRQQLAEAKQNLATLQTEYLQASDALTASASRMHALQTQTDAVKNVAEEKTAVAARFAEAIAQVQQLPLLPENARLILQPLVPPTDMDKVRWLFHHFDTDRNGLWSFEEMYRLRGLSWKEWVTLCGSVGADYKGPGLSLAQVEAVYSSDGNARLDLEYDRSRSSQVCGLEECVDAEAWSRRELMEFAEAAARRAIEKSRAAIAAVDPQSPIRNTLNQVKRETHLSRMEHAEHEERMLSALLYSNNNALSPSRVPPLSPRFSSPPQLRSQSPEVIEIQRSIDRLSSQVAMQHDAFGSKLAQLGGDQPLTPQNELGNLISIIDNLRDEKLQLETENSALRSALARGGGGGGDAVSTSGRALRCTMAKLLQRHTHKSTACKRYIQWRLFAVSRRGMQYNHMPSHRASASYGTPLYILQEAESTSRRLLYSSLEDSVAVLREMSFRTASAVRFGGPQGRLTLTADTPIPLDVHEESSRGCVAAEEFGARVALIKWKLNDAVQHVQMAEVSGVMQNLQSVVAGLHVPPEVRARFAKLRTGYGAVGAMTRRLAELEARTATLREERNVSLTQAAAADQRLAEYRARIHKLRDEARSRNDRSASRGGGADRGGASGSPAHLSQSPSPRRLQHHSSSPPGKVEQWSSELSPPPRQAGWE